jgi:3-hydroxyacyl-CoA dehydrogenase
MLVRALTEAYRLGDELEADRFSADRAVSEGGPAPMGPFALGDLIGLDTTLHVQRDLEDAYGDRFAAGVSLTREVAADRLGQKSGAGLVTGVSPGPGDLHGPAIARRYYLGAFDEACRCLEDGIGAPADIDVAMQLGAGWTIGPLAWADHEGLREVARRLDALADGGAPRFAPRPVLTERVAAGATFTATDEETA